MEISGAALRRTPAVSGVRALRDSGCTAPSTAGLGRRARVSCRPGGVSGGEGRVAFSDMGHLKYYASPVRCGGGSTKKEEKKRAKLVKGLSRDLAALCTVGIGADAGEGLAREVKGKMILEAAELLLAELKQLRAQEKEMKRKRKEEEKKAKGCANDGSSSSSSESSDDDDECIRMSNLRTPAVQEPKPESLSIPNATPELNLTPEPKPKPKQECCNSSVSVASFGCCSGTAVAEAEAEEKPVSKIEVCMGGKCKRSGALELMEEFNKKIGLEGAVVGCKCMGKCREGPNVRVFNHSAARVPNNPLCLGVGLEDVGSIVANFFGDKDVGLIAA